MSISTLKNASEVSISGGKVITTRGITKQKGFKNFNHCHFTRCLNILKSNARQSSLTSRDKSRNLHDYVISSAFHDSAELMCTSRCHLATRAELQSILKEWSELKGTVKPVHWLAAPEGVGKTAIARTFADSLQQHGRLAGAFCFSRKSHERNNDRYLVTTLAHQLCFYMPSTKPHIEEALARDRFLLDKVLRRQMIELLVNPLATAIRQQGQQCSSFPPKFIIIDGLDECTEGRDGHSAEQLQQEILEAIEHVVSQDVPIRFFVTSRPDRHIRDRFEERKFKEITCRTDLMPTTLIQRADIRRFFVSHFVSLKCKNVAATHIWDAWIKAIPLIVMQTGGSFRRAKLILERIRSTGGPATPELIATF